MALLATATRLGSTGGGGVQANLYEQGYGKINLQAAEKYLAEQLPDQGTVQVFPSTLYFTSDECPYMWPYCEMEIYQGRLPIQVM